MNYIWWNNRKHCITVLLIEEVSFCCFEIIHSAYMLCEKRVMKQHVLLNTEYLLRDFLQSSAKEVKKIWFENFACGWSSIYLSAGERGGDKKYIAMSCRNITCNLSSTKRGCMVCDWGLLWSYHSHEQGVLGWPVKLNHLCWSRYSYEIISHF